MNLRRNNCSTARARGGGAFPIAPIGIKGVKLLVPQGQLDR